MSRHAAPRRAPNPILLDDGPTSRAEHHLAIPLMAFASIGVATVHGAVVPEHDDWLPSAAFFAAIAVFQLAWGVFALGRPARPLFLAVGIIVNFAAVALWLVSRTAGMPAGPHQGEAEPFARTDVLAAVLEVLLAGAALWVLSPRSGEVGVRRPPAFVLASGGSGAVVSAVAVIALSGAAGHAHAPMGSHGEGHDGHDLQPVGVLRGAGLPPDAGPTGQSITVMVPGAAEQPITPFLRAMKPPTVVPEDEPLPETAIPAADDAGSDDHGESDGHNH